MRVVVTGASGNVGTSLVASLSTDDAVDEVVAVARRPVDLPLPKVRWVTADLLTDDLGPMVAGAGAVVHLAWIFQPSRRPLLTWENNVLGSLRLFGAVAGAGVPVLVHASSVGAYSPGPPDGRPVDESWPTHALPTAAYGREKSYLERVLDSFERDHPHIRVVRMRPGFIFKAASAAEQRRIFAGPLLPNGLLRPGWVPVVPRVPGLRFQALHSSDAAEAYRLALHRDVRGPVNLAAEPVVGVEQIAELLGARVVDVPRWALRGAVAAAWRTRLIPTPSELLDLFLTLPLLDTSRARLELGWQPRLGAVETLDELLAGMRRGSGGGTPPLDPRAGGRARLGELATGLGSSGGVTHDGR